MRYLIGFMFLLTGLLALPLSASAQDAEESATPESSAEEPAPTSEPAPKEPALQLKLDKSGVEVVPSPPRTEDGYTLEEMELRVKRAKIGVGVSGGALLVGAVISLAVLMIGVSCVASFEPCSGSQTSYLAGVITGGVLFVGGLAGTITSGIKLRRRKRDRDSLKGAHYGTPRRVQWDLETSRVVF
jgi:hypothetical protein